MLTAEYLFPSELDLSPCGLRNILFIGSCLSEFYATAFQQCHPGLQVEHILFNNAQTLPVKSREQLAAYDLQYIQLPVRAARRTTTSTTGPRAAGSLPSTSKTATANMVWWACCSYCKTA
ncbi:hypothetical protein [Rugamonas aquatica]|uniref:Uncharacterized protein n=1 Tax=Rugamonas aquatica TaxID=2743357 RepID=A0A6A7NAZ2_9BURK|nr:hypothetical protein [Rugamonas aquatica]MQA42319.1 hypothetical protein [Rugamonas aquatica]